MISFEENTPRFKLTLEINRIGSDLAVNLSGGDEPHIGAVALAVPHSSLSGKEKYDASVSVMTVTGHKEDGLAHKLAYELSVEFCCVVSVSCGIHLDSATKEEIAAILAVSDKLLAGAVAELRKSL